MHSTPVLSLSSSVNSRSSGELEEISLKVAEEFREQSVVSGELDFDEEEVKKNDNVDGDGDGDFEFAFDCTEPNSSPISADEIFYNGQIRPTLPIFNRDLVVGEVEMDGSNSSAKSPSPPSNDSNRLQLSQHFIEDRGTPSSSSSEADELDGVQPDTYCVWTPKAESQARCKKSNSTGSSKRWNFRDLLHRSNSDGKDNFVFVIPSNANSKKKAENAEKATKEEAKVTGYVKAKRTGGGVSATAAHEAHYVKNRGMKESDRLRSYLPYRQDLVGFFANMNGLSRNIRPF